MVSGRAGATLNVAMLTLLLLMGPQADAGAATALVSEIEAKGLRGAS